MFESKARRVVVKVGGRQKQTYFEKVETIQPANLIGHWPMDEKSGVTSVDHSAQANHGTYRNAAGVLNGVTLGQPGIGDGSTAALFDGTNGYNNLYSAGLAADFNGSEGTIAGWLKVADAANWSAGTMRRPFVLRVDDDNRVYADIGAVANTLRVLYEAGNVANQRDISTTTTGWFHVAMSWSKSSGASGEVIVYFNGAKQGATMTNLGSWVGALAATSVTLGANNTTPQFVWAGTMAHFALWNTPLNATQVASLAVLPL